MCLSISLMVLKVMTEVVYDVRFGMKSWQMIGGLLLTWLVLMMYMSTNLMGSGEGSSRVERQLRRAMEELDMLHAQNIELQNLASELK